MIKRDLYIKNNIRHPINISQGEDLAVTPRLLYFAERIVKINKAYVHYIQNPKSISNTSNIKKIREVYIALDILENFFDYKNNYIFERFKLNHLSTWLFKEKYDFKNEEYSIILKEYLEEIKKLKIKTLREKILYSLSRIATDKIAFIILWHISKIKQKLKNI